jgi:phosphatidylcholine synthase
MFPRLSAFLVHCFTASGAALGFAALADAIEGRFSAMFSWLGAALVVDAVDGTLARRFNVEKFAPHIDGLLLDLVVDFLTYVIVPLAALWRSGLLAPPFAVFICCIVSGASALYFADRRMKTPDLWFRGFPAIWNVLAFYLLVLRPEPLVATLIVIAAACLMFVPAVFVHPLRVVRLRKVTMTATGVWAAAAIAAVAQDLSGAGLLVKAALIAVAVYFLALPLFRNAPLR